jgi:hypothetical protein
MTELSERRNVMRTKCLNVIGLLAVLVLIGVGLIRNQPAHAWSEMSYDSASCVSGPHSGAISADENWCQADNPHVVSGDVTVNEGVTLTIEPGTTVKFDYRTVDLNVQGTLLAQGTYTDTILFTSGSDAPNPGDWGHVHFLPASTNSVLEYVTVEYGGSIHTNDSLRADTSSLAIRYSTIAYSGQDGIRLEGSAPIIEYNSIIENGAYGVNNLDDTILAFAPCNWWGHASGPYHPTLNSGGQGQDVSDDVFFFAWLESPGGECTFRQLFLPFAVRESS